MRLLTVLILSTFVLFARAQEQEVLLVKGIPVIRYTPANGQTSYDAYRMFGMEEAEFVLLNPPPDTSKTITDSSLLMSVKNLVRTQCDGGDCTTLFYAATDGDNFKKIAGYFGITNPFEIKQLNPQLEAVSTGKWIRVGFIPNSILKNVPANYDGRSAESGEPNGGPVANPGNSNVKTNAAPARLYEGKGTYEQEFQAQASVTKTGRAGAFRSFGGWYDGKFYILVNGVEPGKVVKITNTHNGKFIFAKVVSPLPDMKSEKTLTARISNAGCAALDYWEEGELDVEISN